MGFGRRFRRCVRAAALASLAWSATSCVTKPAPAGIVAARGDVKVERIAVDGRFGHLEIAGLGARGTDLSAADIAHLFDPVNADAARTGWQGHAADVRIGRMDLRIGAGDTISAEGVELDSLGDGKAAVLRIARLRFASTRLPLFTSGPITITGLDVGLLIAVVTSNRRDPDMPVATVAERTVVEHLGGQDGSSGLTIASLRIDGLKLRPLAMTFASIGRGVAGGDGEFSRTRERLLDELAESIAVGELDVAGVAGPFVKLGRLTLSYAHGLMGRVALHDAESMLDDLRLRETTWEDLDIRELLAARQFSSYAPRAVFLMQFRHLPRVATRGRVAGLVVGRRAIGWMMDGLVPFAIESFGIDRTTSEDDARSTVTWSLDHLTAAVDASQSLLQPLRDIGYQAVDVSGRLSIARQNRKEALSDDLSVHAPGMGKLTLHLHWSDVAADPAKDDEITARAALLSARLVELELRLQDDGLVERILAAGSREQHVRLDAYRASVADWARAGIIRGLGDTASTRSLGDAVAAFLERPRTLAVKVMPQPPLEFADLPLLRDPRALLRRLRIEAKATR